jgi:hypothetical protein
VQRVCYFFDCVGGDHLIKLYLKAQFRGYVTMPAVWPLFLLWLALTNSGIMICLMVAAFCRQTS